MSPAGSAKTPPPEERLLRLIRGKKPEPTSSASATPAVEAASTPVAGRSWDDRGARVRWPRWVAGILGLIVMVEIGFIVFHVVQPMPQIELPPPSDAARSNVRPPVSEGPPPPPLSAHAAKPLFAAPAPVRTESKPVAAPSRNVNALAARLSLLGIVAGEPAQVIIEDSQTNKTYFVEEGQAVVEGAVVQEITDSRVTLDLFGETIDLNL